MTVRVHELAKELKVTSKELTDKLKSLKIDAKSHMSVLSDDDVKKAKAALKPLPAGQAGSAKAEAKPAAKPAAPAKAEPKASAPAPSPAKGGSLPDRQAGASGGKASMSIEDAKKELLFRRGEMRAAQTHTAAPPRRPAMSTPPVETRRAPVTSAPPKPKPAAAPEVKRASVPSVSAPSAPHEAPAPVAAAPRVAKKLELPAAIVVKDLAAKINLKPADLIARLIKLGIFANINQSLNFDTAQKIAIELGYEVERPTLFATSQEASSGLKIERPAGKPGDAAKLKTRAPIVTFMGHVDHGKTSLLDAIRKTKVAAGEAGGITQHIGAYEVFMENGHAVTFLDTPGHEAFTAMRARGARATDVVVLVIAADDSVMPQTEEAIDHAKAAGVPILVAINKVDLPSANVDRVKKDLMEHGLMSEEWGGKTIMVGVSAKTGVGIDQLLEMLALESELLELKADPTADASGVVVEAQLSKDTGVLATVLVQDGTLRVGDVVVVGDTYCRVRAMINDRGQRIKEAPPSMPVEILGLPSVPRAGDRFYTVKDERAAKEICDKKQESSRAQALLASHVTLEHIFEDVKSGKVEELKLIVKSDVQGSVEALRTTLAKIPAKNVRLSIIHTGIGEVSESDVMLAAASNAVVIGFHVSIAGAASTLAERENVDVRFYEIIYEVKNAIEKAMEGLLEPEKKEILLGAAEVRQVFKVSKRGTIAGCAVVKGKIVRNFMCHVTRAGVKLHQGKIESLKRFKDDAREVLEGFECGIGVANFDDIEVGDRIEVYEVQEKARKLE